MRTKGDTSTTPLIAGQSARLTVASGPSSTERERRASLMQIEGGCIVASLPRTVRDEHPRLQAIQRGTAVRSGGAEARFAAREGTLSLRRTAILFVRILLGAVLVLTSAVAGSLAFLVFFGVLVP